ITLIWAVEAAILFWYGRVKQVRHFEYFSYPLMGLATPSLLINWVTSYSERTYLVSDHNLRPILNGDLVTAFVFVGAFVLIFQIDGKSEFEPAIPKELQTAFRIILPAVILAAIYNTFRTEIDNYYNLKIVESRESLKDSGRFSRNRDLAFFNAIWQIDYSILFLAVISFVSLRRVCSVVLGYAHVVLSVIAFIAFLAVGVPLFHELRESHMHPEAALLWGSGAKNIAIRYIS